MSEVDTAEVKMTPVNSSNISAIGYDHFSNTMHVEFQSGNRYAYFDVPPDVHLNFVNADSIGSHFAKHIRFKYQTEKV